MKQLKGQLIVVNEKDEWLGTMDKMQAHHQGVLHRAFSVFILNDKNEMLLQRRALSKYHSAGLWSNACCSHPYPGESTLAGAHRRLQEEMGFDCELEPIFNLRYKANVGNDLIENEYDHIYLGYYNKDMLTNEEEVSDHKFMQVADIVKWMQEQPDQFTAWFHLALPKFITYLQQQTIAA